MIFYKYRGDVPFTESVITTRKVFLATAHELNDPFECTLQQLGGEWIANQTKQAMEASLSGFAHSALSALRANEYFFDVPPQEIQRCLEAIFNAEDLEGKYDNWRNFIELRVGHPPSDFRRFLATIDNQLVETGIFSMSRDPVQPLLWAHYGQEHRGICLGFSQSPGSKLADVNHGLDVIYSDALPEMDPNGFQHQLVFSMDNNGKLYTSGQKLAFSDRTFQRVVTTKPTCWSYEQEFRYIEPFGGLVDWPGDLVECTFGLRCPESRRKHYIELLQNNVPNEVRLFEVRAKPGTNTLERVALLPSATTPKVADGSKVVTDDKSAWSENEFIARIQQLIQKERYGDAIYQINQNAKGGTISPRLMHLLATAHGLAHEHEQALSIYRELSEIYPDVAASWYGMGVALQHLKRREEALPMFKRAFELNPDDPSIALNLGAYLILDPITKAEGITCLEKAERLAGIIHGGGKKVQRV